MWTNEKTEGCYVLCGERSKQKAVIYYVEKGVNKMLLHAMWREEQYP